MSSTLRPDDRLEEGGIPQGTVVVEQELRVVAVLGQRVLQDLGEPVGDPPVLQGLQHLDVGPTMSCGA